MLFPYPSFINQPEQDDSRILYNNMKIVLESSIKEIWYDVDWGTKMHNLLEEGITALSVAEVQMQIEEKLMKYFKNDIRLNFMDIIQNGSTISVSLNYTELKTGKHNTLKTEQKFINTMI